MPLEGMYLGDCLNVLPTIGKVDVLLTDPPYGIKFDSNSAKVSRFEMIYGDDNFNLSSCWTQLCDAVRSGGALYLFCRWDIAYQWAQLIQPDNQIVISRGRSSMGDLDNYSTEYEVILFKRKGKHQIDATELKIRNNSHKQNPPPYKSRMGNLWTDIVSNEAWERAEHPTQKTVESCKRIIMASSSPGDTILDPFMGSGTTGVACARLGRNFIGIERDPTYFAIAEKRIGEARSQLIMELA